LILEIRNFNVYNNPHKEIKINTIRRGSKELKMKIFLLKPRSIIL
jgi:hypothetical protein